MRDRRVTTLLFVIAVLMQVSYINSMEIGDEALSFITAYKPSIHPGDLVIRGLYTYFPIPFILFMSAGLMSNLRGGYTSLMIIRNYSRSKLIMKMVSRTVFVVFFATAFQVIVSVLVEGLLEDISTVNAFMIIAMYFCTVLALTIVEFVLESFIPLQQAVTIINIYFVVSLLIPTEHKGSLLNYLFIPRLAFANTTWESLETIQSGSFRGLAVILGIAILSFLICVKRYKNADIY